MNSVENIATEITEVTEVRFVIYDLMIDDCRNVARHWFSKS